MFIKWKFRVPKVKSKSEQNVVRVGWLMALGERELRFKA